MSSPNGWSVTTNRDDSTEDILFALGPVKRLLIPDAVFRNACFDASTAFLQNNRKVPGASSNCLGLQPNLWQQADINRPKAC
jgi:hypothetical protein